MPGHAQRAAVMAGWRACERHAERACLALSERGRKASLNESSARRTTSGDTAVPLAASMLRLLSGCFEIELRLAYFGSCAARPPWLRSPTELRLTRGVGVLRCDGEFEPTHDWLRLGALLNNGLPSIAPPSVLPGELGRGEPAASPWSSYRVVHACRILIAVMFGDLATDWNEAEE